MSTLRDQLLPVVDQLRALPQQFGIRRYTVTLRTRTWSGDRAGRGTPTDADVVLSPVPRVRVVTTAEIAASGGTYREGDFRVSAITPNYAGGGYSPTALQVRPTALNQDVTVLLTGDEGTVECNVVEFHFDRPFTYSMVVREKRTAAGTSRG